MSSPVASSRKATQLASSWYYYLESNIYIAGVLVILTGFGFAISLAVRDMMYQISCKVLSTFRDQQGDACSTDTFIVTLLNFWIILLLVIMLGYCLMQSIKLRLRMLASNITTLPQVLLWKIIDVHKVKIFIHMYFIVDSALVRWEHCKACVTQHRSTLGSWLHRCRRRHG